ncbi:iron-containing redox enzyme family protein [Acaryochloris sp. IP29b_bin.148]|uniref:TenA family transcriptional regulator n=1 Tax=Acaryochloris sp. IP29b_bin.148 TaxID=2969218 RepID=UPI0026195EE1|nr:iron-containing redox enzyme family protein [Acaryochloris sp. IP29b_bin.148]
MKTITAYSVDSFKRITEYHPLWKHRFLERCRTGELTLSEVRVLAVQMYKFSQAFNRILASIMSCCSDEKAQLVLLENLWDEMGQGNLAHTHPELFRHFTRTLGIDDGTLLLTPPEPETQALIDTYLALPHQYGYLAALGAVCFASEGIVNSLYTQIRQGIVDTSPFSTESLIFFEVHIDLDDDHAAHLEALIEPRLKTVEESIYLHRAIKKAMDARLQFFNGIERASQAVAQICVA